MRAAARTVASRRPERRLRMVHMASRRRAARGRRLVSETQQDEEESAAEALEASDSADSGAEDNAGDVEEIRRRAASAAQLGRVRLPSWLPLRRASSPLGEMKCFAAAIFKWSPGSVLVPLHTSRRLELDWPVCGTDPLPNPRRGRPNNAG